MELLRTGRCPGASEGSRQADSLQRIKPKHKAGAGEGGRGGLLRRDINTALGVPSSNSLCEAGEMIRTKSRTPCSAKITLQSIKQ